MVKGNSRIVGEGEGIYEKASLKVINGRARAILISNQEFDCKACSTTTMHAPILSVSCCIDEHNGPKCRIRTKLKEYQVLK